MTVQFADRVRVTTATTGTGTINLGAAITGFQTFASAVTNGQLVSGATVYYVIEDTGSTWETGHGIYTAGSPDTLTRTVACSSAGTTTALSLSGSAVVYLAVTAASMAVDVVTSGTIDNTVIGGITPANGTFSGLNCNSGYFNLGISALGNPALISINTAATQTRQMTYQTAGIARWTTGVTTTAESGSNAGCDFVISNWSDSGGFIGSVLQITRSTGTVSLPISLTVGSPTGGAQGTGTVNATGYYLNGTLVPTYTASNVAITGGSINGTTVGASTPSSGIFTTLTSSTGALNVGGNAISGNAQLNVNGPAGSYRGVYYQSAGAQRYAFYAGADAESTPITTTLSAAATTNATTLTLASTTNVAVGQTLGAITGISGGTQITNVAGSVITISPATTAAISSGTTITIYRNTGTSFYLSCYTDDGYYLASPFAVSRSTGAITLASLVGTVSGNNAPAGSVGEFLSVNIPTASAVSLTSGTASNVTSLALTAGDWDIWGNIITKPAGTTTQTIFAAGLNSTSATLPTPGPTTGGLVQMSAAFTAGGALAFDIPASRITISSSQTWYLVINCTFGTSTNAAFGYIAARRRR